MRGLVLGSVFALSGTCLLAHPHTDVDQQVALTLGVGHIGVNAVIVPSVEAGPAFLSRLDTDSDGAVDEGEAETFARDMLSTMSLAVGNTDCRLELSDVSVADPVALGAGLGAITVTATVPMASPGGDGFAVSFGIAFAEFDQDWFIQPYFEPSVSLDTSRLRIDRSARNTVLIASDEPGTGLACP